MSHFSYRQQELYIENLPAQDIAEQYGTPCYVYSRAAIEENWLSFANHLQSLPHRICYAVKANSNLAILNILAKLGSGFDIVSLGELKRVMAAGGNPAKVVFSGVGKNDTEILHALKIGIHCFNVESEAELERLNLLSQQVKQVAQVALRINPNIDAGTHPYIATGMKENKFGLDLTLIDKLCLDLARMPYIKLIGVACHIGSQLTELTPYEAALDKLIELHQFFTDKGIFLQHINIGGGLGVKYQNEQPPAIADYVAILKQKLHPYPVEVIIEPGRVITANAGILLTRVEYIKETPFKNFAIVDAAMNDLIRPALYDAWQNILPASLKAVSEPKLYDIVGPVCESADFLGKDRLLSLAANQLLAVYSAGAYGFSMSSNYNSRPRAAEVLVDKQQSHLIRARESIEELYAHERIPDFA